MTRCVTCDECLAECLCEERHCFSYRYVEPERFVLLFSDIVTLGGEEDDGDD